MKTSSRGQGGAVAIGPVKGPSRGIRQRADRAVTGHSRARDRTEESCLGRSFADAALIVLNENNMAARAIHGMIPLGGWSEEVRK